MDKRYVRCNHCNQRIFFGSKVNHYKGYCGVYCSAECFAQEHSVETELNEELADNSCCTVFDDDKRKRELKETMERLIKEMNQCKAEYDALIDNTK